MSFKINNLIFSKICEYLDLVSISNLSKTSKEYNRYFKHEGLWKLKTEQYCQDNQIEFNKTENLTWLEFYKDITNNVFDDKIVPKEYISFSNHNHTIAALPGIPFTMDVFSKRQFKIGYHQEMSWSIKIDAEGYIGAGLVHDKYIENKEHAYDNLSLVFYYTGVVWTKGQYDTELYNKYKFGFSAGDIIKVKLDYKEKMVYLYINGEQRCSTPVIQDARISKYKFAVTISGQAQVTLLGNEKKCNMF